MTQEEDHIAVFEGSLVQVKCNYSYTGSPVLFWYVQYPGQGLQILLKHTSSDSAKGFTAALDRGEKSFHLQKPSAQLDDSATYYCALSGTATALAREAEHKPVRVTQSTSCQLCLWSRWSILPPVLGIECASETQYLIVDQLASN